MFHRLVRSAANCSWLFPPPTFDPQHAPVQVSESAASESGMRCTLPLHRAALWGSARPPQAADLQFKLLLAMRALSLNAVMPVFVDAVIEVLQVGQIRREQPCNDFRIDDFHRAEPRDHARQQNYDQVSGIALHPRVLD